MPLIPAFLQAMFTHASGSHQQNPASPKRVKRKGSKLAMIFSGKKRERSNSKATDDHDIVHFDEDIATSNAVRASRDGNSVRSSRNDEDVNEDKRKSKNLSRVPSKIKLLWNKNGRPQIVAMTDEMIRLETVIQSEKGRKKLVDELLALKGPYSIMVRFCYAVEQFDNCVDDDKERTSLALSLIDMFVRDGGKFHIALSEARKQAILVDGKINQLLDAKREVLEELCKNSEVMAIVDVVETMDGV